MAGPSSQPQIATDAGPSSSQFEFSCPIQWDYERAKLIENMGELDDGHDDESMLFKRMAELDNDEAHFLQLDECPISTAITNGHS